MTPEKKLARMCRRSSVPYEDALSMLPLVRRALSAEPRLRGRLFAVVESTLARYREERLSRIRLERHLDRQYLIAIASILHRWDPGTAGNDAGRLPEGGGPRP